MRTNVGSLDRVVRIVAGLAALSLVVFIEGDARWWGLVGLVPLLTGLVGWCPAYPLLGLNTCRLSRAR